MAAPTPIRKTTSGYLLQLCQPTREMRHSSMQYGSGVISGLLSSEKGFSSPEANPFGASGDLVKNERVSPYTLVGIPLELEEPSL
ncbi:hypothetical protein NDU88_002589 [Pleurodeles waltl]|uniref:Uncharacterized protein n=1 Tax=Pleurodeles waltl TaxID=8319 RepID=A0AAV7W3R7_PLEWA|nr:hypothetical protein NDU88_002589 [Pleurodeles waltl]